MDDVVRGRKCRDSHLHWVQGVAKEREGSQKSEAGRAAHRRADERMNRAWRAF